MVPSGYKTLNGLNLGNWVSSQRIKRNILNKRQLDALDSIEFIWNKFEYQWRRGFQELLSYQTKYGDCLVHSTFKTESGFSLGAWVSVQRRNKDKISTDRMKSLDQIGFLWKVK